MSSLFPELEIHKSISTPSISQLTETSSTEIISESPSRTTNSYLPSPRRFINSKKKQNSDFTVKNSNQFHEVSQKLAQYEKAYQLILQRAQMLPNNELPKIINEFILSDLELPKDLKPMYKPAIIQFQEEKTRETPKQIMMCLVPKNNQKNWQSFIIKDKKEENLNQLTRQELSRVQINETFEQEEVIAYFTQEKEYQLTSKDELQINE